MLGLDGISYLHKHVVLFFCFYFQKKKKKCKKIGGEDVEFFLISFSDILHVFCLASQFIVH
jgi:hypothetical protein